METKANDELTILDLPDLPLFKIFEYLSYQEVAKNRIVCRTFDNAGKCVLNSGFLKSIRRSVLQHKRIKSICRDLSHNLGDHLYLLRCLACRLYMLSLTYGKFIEAGICCFIPGLVLDEIFKLIDVARQVHLPAHPNILLEKFRLATFRAMDHFNMVLATDFKRELYFPFGIKLKPALIETKAKKHKSNKRLKVVMEE